MNYKYQVCAMFTDPDTGETSLTGTDTVAAESYNAAKAAAAVKYRESEFRVYPMATFDDGESIARLAKFTLASFENYERRNNRAVMNTQRRKPEERDDLKSVACVRILEVLAVNPAADMHAVHRAAWSAIAATQKGYERISEREYNPDFVLCNVVPRVPHAMNADLDALIREAIDAVSSTLTPAQKTALDYSERGMSTGVIAERTGKTRSSVYNSLQLAYYRILTMAVQLMDRGLYPADTFSRSGISRDDISDTLATLAKRAHLRRVAK